MKIMVFPAALALGAALLSACPAQAADEFFVTIDGVKQGVFHGGSTQDKHKGEIVGLKYDYSATVPTSATGAGAGKMQHSPITFEKEWDAATTQIYQALATGETLKSVRFDFYNTNADGQTLAFRVTLTNAAVVGIHQHVGDTLYNSTLDPHRYEDISLNFQKIEIQDETGSTIVTTVGVLPRRRVSPVRPVRLTARAPRPTPLSR